MSFEHVVVVVLAVEVVTHGDSANELTERTQNFCMLGFPGTLSMKEPALLHIVPSHVWLPPLAEPASVFLSINVEALSVIVG